MRISAAAVVATLLVLAGCGGGGTRLSRDAYVAKADAICRDVDARQKKLAAPISIDEIPAYVDRALPLYDDALGRIRKLRPPGNLDDAVHRWLDSLAQGRKLIDDLGKAASNRDVAKARALGAKASAAATETHTLARAIGLTDCANS